MWTKATQEHRLMRTKGLGKRLKNPEEEEFLWFFFHERYFHQDEEVNRRKVREGHIMTPQFSPHSVNGDADAYVKTLQAIEKPPWIDSVPNEARPRVSQQDSASFHRALKTQDWMDGRGFSSCHTKLTATS
ncbi:hypothetical protein ACTXT7_004636 [Hymenolepis weldensis]